MVGLDNYLIDAKYHLSIAERMLKSYYDFEEKMFLVGVINALAKASSNVVLGFLLFDGRKSSGSEKNIRVFLNKVAPKYLHQVTSENLFKSLEIQKAQDKSPIEFARGDKIILLIDGRYRFLTSERLSQFKESIEESIRILGNFRQV